MKIAAGIAVLALGAAVASGGFMLRQRSELAELRRLDRQQQVVCAYLTSSLKSLAGELETTAWSERAPRARFEQLTAEPLLRLCSPQAVVLVHRAAQVGTCDVTNHSYACVANAARDIADALARQ